MNWNSNKAIYLQIADRIIDEILAGKAQIGDRALSVREYAAQVQVNPNTVVRSYGFLEAEGILLNQRGIGFFISAVAQEKARAFKRKEFMEEILPEVFRTMDLLQMSIEELNDCYHQNINHEKTN
jgi:DNA-binding transcriptional regulator YhcF (GntR family)